MALVDALPEHAGRVVGWIRINAWLEPDQAPVVIPPASLDDALGADVSQGLWAWLGHLPATWPLDATITRLVRRLRPGGWIAVSWGDESSFDLGVLCEREPTNRVGLVRDALHLAGVRDVTLVPGAVPMLVGRRLAPEPARVTVVVLACNQERTLAATLDSVVTQTHPDVELLIVDDGSRDSTCRVIQRYRDRARVLSHANWGVARSLNHALLQATGQHFTWIGGDNLLYPTALDVLASELDADPGLGGVYGDHDVVSDAGRYVETERKPAFTIEAARERYLMGIVFLTRTSVARAVGGFDASLAVAEDDAFWLAVAERNRVLHVPQVLGAYRFHAPARDAAEARVRALKLAEARRVSRALRRRESAPSVSPTTRFA